MTLRSTIIRAIPAPAGTGSGRASREPGWRRARPTAAWRRHTTNLARKAALRQPGADRHERQQEDDVQTHPREVR